MLWRVIKVCHSFIFLIPVLDPWSNLIILSLVHTVPEKLDSTFRSTVHTNPSRKQRFSKKFFTPKEFESAGCNEGIRLDEKHFENGFFFRNLFSHDNRAISLPKLSTKQVQNDRWFCVFKFHRSSLAWFPGSFPEQRLVIENTKVYEVVGTENNGAFSEGKHSAASVDAA